MATETLLPQHTFLTAGRGQWPYAAGSARGSQARLVLLAEMF